MPTSATSVEVPRFVRLRSGEICTCYQDHDSPDPEAREIVRVCHNDGRRYLCGDFGRWQDCDCPDFEEGGDCPHVAALVDAGVFRPAPGWPEVRFDWVAEPQGDLLYAALPRGGAR